MSYEDERIVSLKFDNANFKKEIDATVKSLAKLEKSLDLDPGDSEKTFKTISAGCKDTADAISTIDVAIYNVQMQLSALQIIGKRVLERLTDSALAFGKQIYNNTVGQILNGGTMRSANIEAAKFQLEGLHVAWDDIYGDIDYAVKGTAFGLDSAAKAASQLVASQVQLGDEMKAALRGISGVAAMTNSSYDEIAQIFTRIAGQGRLMGMDLLSLGRKGLNTAQILGNALSKSEAEIRDMVSKGQIDFATFAAAMDETFGPHAKDADKTFSGALANMKAALSRTGEAFITPWREMERVIFNAIKALINLGNDALKPAAEGFTELTTMMKNFLEYALRTDGAFGIIIKKLATIVSKILGNKEIQNGVVQWAETIYTWIRSILIVVADLLDISDNVLTTFGINLQNAARSAELFGDKALNFEDVLRSVIWLIASIGNGIRTVAMAFWPLIEAAGKAIFKMIPAGDTLADKIKFIADLISVISIKLANIISSGIQKFLKALPIIVMVVKGAFILAAAAVTVFVAGIINAVKAIKTGIDFILWFGQEAWNAFKNGATAVVNFGSTVWDVFSELGKKVINFFDGVRAGFASLFSPKTVDVEVKSNAKDVEKDINKTTASADKVEESTSKTGITGGKYLQGQEGKILDTKALAAKAQEAKKDATSAANDVDSATATLSTSLLQFGKATANAEDGVAETIQKSEEGGIFGAIKQWFTNVGENIKNFVETVTPILTNPFVILTAVVTGVSLLITGKLLSSVFGLKKNVLNVVSGITGIFNIFPAFADNIKAAAKASVINSIGNAAKGIGAGLLSLAAFIATIVIISKTMKEEDFDKLDAFLERMKKIVVYGVLIPGVVITAITALIAGAVKIHSLTKSVNMLTTEAKNIRTMFSSVGKSVTVVKDGAVATMKAFALAFAEIFAASLIAYAILKYGDHKMFLAACSLMILMMGAIAITMRLLMQSIDKSAMTSIVKEFDFKSKTFKQTSNSAVAGLTSLMLSMALIMVAITASTYLLSRTFSNDPLTAMGSFIALLAVATAAILGVFEVADLASRKLLKSVGYDSALYDKAAKALNEALASMSKLIFSLAVVMLAFSGAMKILSTLSSDELIQGGITLGAMSVVLAVIVGALAAVSKRMATVKVDGIRNTQMDALNAMIPMITAFGATILMIATALSIVSRLGNPEEITKDAVILGALMSAVSGAVVAIMMLSKDKSSTGIQTFFKRRAGQNFNATDEIKMAANIGSVAAVITAMGGAIMAIATALAVVSKLGDPATIDKATNSLLKIFATVSVSVIVLTSMLHNIESQLGSKYKRTSISFASMGSLIALASIIAMVSVLISAIAVSLKLMSGTDIKMINSMSVLLGVVMFSIAGLVAAMGAAVAMIGKTRSPWVLVGILGGVSTVIGILGGVLYALNSVDWGNNGTQIAIAIGAVAGLMGLLSVVAALTGKVEGMQVGIAYVGEIAAIVSAVALALAGSVSLFAFGLDTLGGALERFAKLDGNGIQSVLECVGNGLKSFGNIGAIASAFLLIPLSLGLLALAGATWVLSKLDISGAETAMKSLQVVLDTIGSKSMLNTLGMVLLASLMLPLIATNIALAAGLILAGAISLALAFGVLAMTAALGNSMVGTVIEFLMNIITSLSDALNELGGEKIAMLNVLMLGLVGVAVMFAVVGTSMAAGAIGLAIGFGALLGALAIIFETPMMTYINQLIDEDGLNIIKAMGYLVGAGAIAAIAGLLLSVGSTGLLVGMAALLGTAALAGLVMTMFEKAFGKDGSEVTMLYQNIGVLALVGAISLVAGTLLSLGAIPLAVGALLLTVAAGLAVAAGWLLAQATSLLAMAFEAKRMNTILTGSGKMVLVMINMAVVAGIFVVACVAVLGGAVMLGAAVGVLILATLPLIVAIALIVDALSSLDDDGIFSGMNLVAGLIEGISEMLPDLTDLISDLASSVLDIIDDIWDINSPSAEAAKRGVYMLLGLEEGFDQEEAGVKGKIATVAANTIDTLDSTLEKYAPGIYSTIQNIGDGIADFAGGFSDLGGLLGGNFAASLQNAIMGGGKAALEKQVEQLNAQDKAISDAFRDRGQTMSDSERERLTAEQMEISKQKKDLKAQIALYDEQENPIKDANDWRGGGLPSTGSSATSIPTSDELPSNLSSLNGGNSGLSNLANTAGSNVGGAVTNNTYNFVQNNYSPEPIDRTELYRQTNNQLNTWYKWLRES